MTLSKADRKKLPRLLDDLAEAVEELLLTGLTTASPSTRQTLDISFREASRMRLLRLGSTLRVANEELGRYTGKHPEFSRKRLAFFLNRAWMLSRGLARALREKDDEQFEKLLWIPASQPIDRLEVVTVGVAKKVAKGTFCAFDFRLRATEPAGEIDAGQRLLWSCVFPLKPGTEIPAEGFLHLPQKQKFKTGVFLEGKTIVIQNAAVALDGYSGRISLGEQSTVATGEPFSDWERFLHWDRQAAIERIQTHQPSPFDLEVEMQEEVVLHNWELGKPGDRERNAQSVYSLVSSGVAFDAVVSKGIEGKALKKSLESYRKRKEKPPLLGLMHYEMGRLVLQPLTAFEESGPVHLMISNEKVDRAALLKTLKF